mmetsp:Transcript_2075/g.6056  ORF Transcript_2075/g.6056 Transcript_2075/m.6056 type:complete len:218 (+) Transcript_2075:909-1562(+)
MGRSPSRRRNAARPPPAPPGSRPGCGRRRCQAAKPADGAAAWRRAPRSSQGRVSQAPRRSGPPRALNSRLWETAPVSAAPPRRCRRSLRRWPTAARPRWSSRCRPSAVRPGPRAPWRWGGPPSRRTEAPPGPALRAPAGAASTDSAGAARHGPGRRAARAAAAASAASAGLSAAAATSRSTPAPSVAACAAAARSESAPPTSCHRCLSPWGPSTGRQ